MRFSLSFWRNLNSKQKRLVSVLLVLLVAIIALVVGSLTTLDYGTALSKSNSLNQTLNQSIANNNLVETIFLNNFTLCMLMFIPLFGAGIGIYIMYNTGVALAAVEAVQGYTISLAVADLMINPIFWLEFVSYSLAMAESIWLIRRLLQGRIKELKWTALSITICAVLLIAGAIIEAWEITGHI